MQLVHGRLNRPEKRNLCKCFDRHVNNFPPLEFTRVNVNSILAASTRKQVLAATCLSSMPEMLYVIKSLS